MKESIGKDTALSTIIVKPKKDKVYSIPKRITEVEILEDLYSAYLKSRKDKNIKGRNITRFSARDYEKYKDDNSTSVYTILRRYGSWKNVVELIPDEVIHENKELINKEFHIKILLGVLTDMSNKYHIDDIRKIRVREYKKYQENYYSDYPDWRTITYNIIGSYRWKEVLEEVYKYSIGELYEWSRNKKSRNCPAYCLP